MAFNFPPSPTAGQEFSPVPGVTYVYYSPRWLVKPSPGGGGGGGADVAYVDSQDALRVLKNGDVMSGLLTLSGNPTSPLHAVTKQYADALEGGGGGAGITSVDLELHNDSVGGAIFGDTLSPKCGQSFIAAGTEITSVSNVHIALLNTLVDGVTIKVFTAHTDHTPIAQVGVTSDVENSFTGTMTATTFTFSTPVPVTPGVEYCLVIERTGATGNTDRYFIGIATLNRYSGGNYLIYNGTTWVNQFTQDLRATIHFTSTTDALIASLNSPDNSSVNKAGDTMVGDLSIRKVSPRLDLDKLASGQSAAVYGKLNGSNRWSMFLGSTAGETGTDGVGSNFVLNAHGNGGSAVATVLSGERNTGLLTVWGEPTQSFGIATKSYADKKVPISGGFMNGSLQVPTLIVENTTASEISLRAFGNPKWGIAGDVTDFRINYYDDSFALVGPAVTIARATGVANFTATPTLPIGYPTAPEHATNKKYVDEAIANALAVMLGTANELRFTRTSSQHMTRLFGITSNSAWTLSMWVKRVGLGTRQALFGVESTTGAGKLHLEFEASNSLSMYGGTAGDTAIAVGPVYNSTTLWYHVVWSVPAGAPSSPKFHNIYVNNGSAMTGIIAGNDLNAAVTHYIGQPSKYPDVIMKDVVFVDGAQVPPTSFGEDVAGTWTPKVYTGPFGANGFKLNFKTGDLGKDITGNSNHWTPVNFP